MGVPAMMSDRGVSRTLPTGSQRENTHGQTSPVGEMASTPSAQCPQSWSVLLGWSRTPRPNWRM
jgi:hypothetical protein